jgi:hypothetical protein
MIPVSTYPSKLIASSPHDWLDDADPPEGYTALQCARCAIGFHGWKFKTVCRVCAVPVFPTQRHIACVAVCYAGQVYHSLAPDRHHHVLRIIHAEHKKTWPNVQGFLDNRGKFLRRHDALRVALAARQVLDVFSIRANRLFSEDLW